MRDPRLYDSISSTYRATRRADPRIAARIHAALGDAERIINIGAGTGNYEPADRSVIAVEPSEAMVDERPADAAPVVRGVAEALPVPDRSFDAALAALTLHHWNDRRQGLREMRRVARRQVLFTFDPVEIRQFWALAYWPTSFRLPSEQDLPAAEGIAELLDLVDVRPLMVPVDCTDGFGAAFWGRPDAYLDPHVQQGTSWLAQLPPGELAAGAARLGADLRSGEWDRRHGHLRTLGELDVGYRLVIAASS